MRITVKELKEAINAVNGKKRLNEDEDKTTEEELKDLKSILPILNDRWEDGNGDFVSLDDIMVWVKFTKNNKLFNDLEVEWNKKGTITSHQKKTAAIIANYLKNRGI